MVLQVLHVVGLGLKLLAFLQVALPLLEDARVLRADGLLDQAVDFLFGQVQLHVCVKAAYL